VTTEPEATRRTAREVADGGDRLVLVGCSFTFGWAVADDQTFARELAGQLPGTHVVNAAVSGYGTYHHDGHPNERLHAWWADCIASALREQDRRL
jgi:hypothetical protein